MSEFAEPVGDDGSDFPGLVVADHGFAQGGVYHREIFLFHLLRVNTIEFGWVKAPAAEPSRKAEEEDPEDKRIREIKILRGKDIGSLADGKAAVVQPGDRFDFGVITLQSAAEGWGLAARARSDSGE